ncbi:securin-like [Pyxicephalus adspersus]|uniref:securin-like n=1 Tax=Pyxicephalus adspersus TaxID=30357 RepID=UPI003B5CC0A5
MATVIFVDQENGDVASTILSKDRLKQTNSAKTLFKTQPGKVFSSSGAAVKPRKALGIVNKQVVSTAVPNQKSALKVKKSAPVTNQISEACVKPRKQSYPEIEKCFPYDPSDFEFFDVPEEHKLSHLYLAGVPLFVHENDAAKFDALTPEPAPMDVPVFGWESDMSSTLPSFFSTLDEITLDLPQITC